jgi:hypothetical protein
LSAFLSLRTAPLEAEWRVCLGFMKLACPGLTIGSNDFADWE